MRRHSCCLHALDTCYTGCADAAKLAIILISCSEHVRRLAYAPADPQKSSAVLTVNCDYSIAFNRCFYSYIFPYLLYSVAVCQLIIKDFD